MTRTDAVRPLEGRRVLELGGYLAAPFGAHILSQLGAEVIKLEAPGGDATRTMVKGGPGGTFIAYSHGKRSLCIDLATPAGQAVLDRLLPRIDILVHNLSPQATRKLCVDADRCHARNPRLVYCQIKGYGDGPRQDEIASNPIIEAATGAMHANMVDGRPKRAGPSYQDMFAGKDAVIGILGALLTGQERAVVEVGLYESGLHVAARDLVAAAAADSAATPAGEFVQPGYGAYRTSDGRWIYLLLLSDQHWAKFCEMADLPEGRDAGLRTRVQRQQQAARVEAAVEAHVKRFSYEPLAAMLQSAGLGFTEVLPPGRVLQDKQALHPGKVVNVSYLGRSHEVAGFPLFPAPAASTAPLLGEHSLEILRELEFSKAQSEDLVREGVVRSAQAC